MNEQTETNRQTEFVLCPRLIPANTWNKYFEWPPPGGIRRLIFHARKNGFHKVIKRVGRRVLIDVKAFNKWVEEQAQSSSEEPTQGQL